MSRDLIRKRMRLWRTDAAVGAKRAVPIISDVNLLRGYAAEEDNVDSERFLVRLSRCRRGNQQSQSCRDRDSANYD